MEILLKQVKVHDIVTGYIDNEEEGVIGFGGNLNIRPAYQREFVYKDYQRNAVLETIIKGFPLNTMYWAENEDGTYELLDGQQRTLSICQYCNNDFSMEFEPGIPKIFANLTDEQKEKILNYELIIYICKGNDKERLDWFRVINISGEELTEQELLNANYTGKWLSDAKKKFSKNNCVAYKIGNKLLSGSPIRQDYLETALKWKSGGKNNIAQYMSQHQHDTDALELWSYFQNVIDWVNTKFPVYRKEMKGIDWGFLYNIYGKNHYDPDDLETEIRKLMSDDDVQSKKEIYEYLLSGKKLEKKLNIRIFTDSQKRSAYEKQEGICALCKNHFDFEEMEGDHIIPWSKGGKTIPENLQMICKSCNRSKGSN